MDQSTWSQAANTMKSVASEASAAAEMSAGMAEACDRGDYVACDSLTREHEAKLKWLAKLDAPTWGAAAAAVSAIAIEKSKA
jgi:hypothetical protein